MYLLGADLAGCSITADALQAAAEARMAVPAAVDLRAAYRRLGGLLAGYWVDRGFTEAEGVTA